jgi:hypothetical protein
MKRVTRVCRQAEDIAIQDGGERKIEKNEDSKSRGDL